MIQCHACQQLISCLIWLTCKQIIMVKWILVANRIGLPVQLMVPSPMNPCAQEQM